MLTSRVFFSLTAILSTLIFDSAHAKPGGVIGEGKGSPSPTFATSLTGGEGCDDDDIVEIRQGYADMAAMFQSSLPFDPLSQPAVEFFGNPISVQNYTGLIEENLRRAANYAKAPETEGPTNSDIHVRCDDPLGICNFGNKREGMHAAYNLGNEPHINFCSDYFRLDGLKKRVDKKSDNQVEKEGLMNYYNRGTLWARMVMHFSEIGKAVVVRAVPGGPNSTREWTTTRTEGAMNTSVLAGVLDERPDTGGPNDIRTLKYAYGATRAKLLAVLSTQMAYDATNNAENYAMFAQARYIMREKGFYPNVPIMDFPNEATVLTNEILQDGERVKYAFFDMTDVVARPANMELRGQPLPSAASTFSRIESNWLLLMALTLAHFIILVPYG